MQSCDRSDVDILEIPQENQINQSKEPLLRATAASEITTFDTEMTNSEKLETGDDDPPRDKQHWRITNDTLRTP